MDRVTPPPPVPPDEPLRPLARLDDGTVKQVNPFTGTRVWTVPGRGHRPLAPPRDHRPGRIDPTQLGRYCAFCEGRYLETTPERERLVRDLAGWHRLLEVPASQLHETTAEFRLIPNLFEIVSYDYWVANHDYRPSPEAVAHQAAYLSELAGRAHLLALLRSLFDVVEDADVARLSMRFFAGCHDVVIARRHFTPGAELDDQLAGSGSLSVEEHEQYVALTIRAMQRLYDANPHAVLVAAFQNWLRPAGASFEHLHKQLVAVDELGPDLERQLPRLAREPDLYRRWGLDYPAEQGLVIAHNDHAVAVAGIGHQSPAVVVWARSDGRPWELSGPAVRGFSDLLHAVHVATGADVPTNEEWHHQPPSVPLPAPLRVVLKWRIATPAGFEGGTKLYINTIDPWTVADRMRLRLAELLASGAGLGDVTLD